MTRNRTATLMINIAFAFAVLVIGFNAGEKWADGKESGPLDAQKPTATVDHQTPDEEIRNDQPTQSRWTEQQAKQHLQNRQDRETWDLELLKRDLEQNKIAPTKPIAFGAFPVPKYELLGKDSFKGIGAGGNFEGLDYAGKSLIYGYFQAAKNDINTDFLKDKPNEVFFMIVALTDFIDKAKFSHAGLHIISRNNPDYIGEGFFKTKTNEIDFTAFITAKRDSFAIVNMRLFDLKFGRTILIAPRKDGSLRSMQIASQIYSNIEVKGHVEALLKKDDVHAFFTDPGNIE